MGENSRVRMAVDWLHAPRKRQGAQQLSVDHASALNITGLVPTQADLGDAPYCWLVVGLDSRVTDDLLTGVVVTDDVTLDAGVNYGQWVIPTSPQLVPAERADIFRVPLFPRAAAADTFLTTPLRPNWVFLANANAQTDLDLDVVFEIPTLDWLRE